MNLKLSIKRDGTPQAFRYENDIGVARLVAERLRRSVAAVFAVALIFTTGCGKNRETAADRAVRDGIFLQSLGSAQPNLDPHLAEQLADGAVLRAVLEGLVAPDPQTLEPKPAAADTWDVSDDGLIYTFHLRENARWSNGDPVTAQDFAFSFRRALSPELGAKNASLMHVLRGARAFNRGETRDFSTVGVEALDAHTLRLTLEARCPYFLSLLTHFVWLPVHPPSVRAGGGETSRDNRWARAENYVGNGPFVPVEVRPDQFIRTTANANYWDAANVKLKGVTFFAFSVQAEEAAFRTGQILATDALPIGKVPAYRREHSPALRIAPSFGVYFYRINTTRPPLDDPRVRRALSAAIGRAQITRHLLNDTYAPANAFTPPGTAGYTPPALAIDDVPRAQQELADAGFAHGAGMREIEIRYNTSEFHRPIAEAVQDIWRRELGITVALRNEEDSVFRADVAALRYDVSRASWFGDYLDPSSFLDIFTSGNANNQTGWSNAEYDRLLAEAAHTGDPARRLALFGEAETILLREAPIIPIYVYSTVRLIDPRVHGWFDNPLDQHPYKAISLETSAP